MFLKRTGVAVAATSHILADYFTRSQLAKEIGRCEETLKRWARLGEGPPVTRIGLTPYYLKTSVTAWLKDCEDKPKKKAA